MILVAGGTGTLGTRVVHLLRMRGLPVRILTRDPARARHLRGEQVEVVAGDVRDPRAVERAVSGARTVISAAHGLTGSGADSPRTVDWLGNGHLMEAAQRAGVEHMVLVSMQGAAPDHPMELARMKASAEQQLRAASLAWTIIRPTAFMETWCSLLGSPLLSTAKTTIFGGGNNPINFVSAYDVARLVERSVADPASRGALVAIGGPENLTLRQFVQVFEDVLGVSGAKRVVPLPIMRAASLLMRPVNPRLARQVQAGIVMDTMDMRFDPEPFQRAYPSIPLTSLAEVVRRDYAATGAQQ